MSCRFLALLCATCVQAQPSHREVCAEGESACADTSSRALLQSQAASKASPIQKVLSLMEGMAEKGGARGICEYRHSGCGSESGSGECHCEGKNKESCMESGACPAYSWKPPKPPSGVKGKLDWYPEIIKGAGKASYSNLGYSCMGKATQYHAKDVLLKGKKAAAAREGRHNKFFTSCQQYCDRCSSCQAISMRTTIKGKMIYRACHLRGNVVYTESTFDLTRAYKYGENTKAFPVSGWAQMVNDKAGVRKKAKVDCGQCGVWIPGYKLPCKCRRCVFNKWHCKAKWFDPRPATTPKPTVDCGKYGSFVPGKPKFPCKCEGPKYLKAGLCPAKWFDPLPATTPKPTVDCGKYGSYVPGQKFPCKCEGSKYLKAGLCLAKWFDPRTTTTTTTTTTKQAKTPPAKQPEGTLFDRLDVDDNDALSRKEFKSMEKRSDDSKLSDDIARRVIERLRGLFAAR